ncbi:hypothetical protein JKP88DRAFT_287513 [Tribonema minus]|uniref:Uncharacterized protein n=1 Tax=Tribonema minus TaxID=303371 RepID=A0A835ZBH0_9STRA|nr:hypothetical protein JKP88DRAFT_287513 [Tribonema minus]
MSCPGGADSVRGPCSGNGVCRSMNEAGVYPTTANLMRPYVVNAIRGIADPAFWDFDMVHGCICDAEVWGQPAWGPIGNAYGTWQNNPRLSGWTGGEITGSIAKTATAAQVEAALEDLSTISDVTVTGSSAGYQVTFVGELGDVPPLVLSSGTPGTTTKGTKKVKRDGNGNAGTRGDCGYNTGQCTVSAS